MRRQRGHTLTELMVGSAIGLLVILAAVRLFVACALQYTTHAEQARVQEAARFALERLVQSGRQASAVRGLDARAMPHATADLALAVAAVNHSDVLRLEAGEDAGLADCAGAVPARAQGGRVVSLYWIGRGGDGEPELRCTYRGTHAWNSAALVRGVEALQVQYGVDGDGDGAPERWVDASAVTAASDWPAVAALRMALLLRGERDVDPLATRPVHSVLGLPFDTAGDAATRRRYREVYGVTIALRNTVAAP